MAAVKGEDWEETSDNPVPGKGAPTSKVHLKVSLGKTTVLYCR